MSHTYSVVPNASKWRYTCFLFQCGISSWILPHLNLMTTIVLRKCILQLNMCFFFSGSGLLLIKTSYLIMTMSQRIQEHEESLLSSAGNKPLSFFKQVSNLFQHCSTSFQQSFQIYFVIFGIDLHPCLTFFNPCTIAFKQFSRTTKTWVQITSGKP